MAKKDVHVVPRGNQWAVEMDDVRRLMHPAQPGRPLSSKSAWDLLAVAAGGPAASALHPSARSRARSRLRNLLEQASTAGLDNAAAALAHALRNRAKRAPFVASPRDLSNIRDDQRVHLSGLSLPESNMSSGDIVEVYVSSDDVARLVDDYLLSPASRDRANVILHVVSSSSDNPGVAALADIASSPLARAADLAEYDGVREKNEAIRLVGALRARGVARV